MTPSSTHLTRGVAYAALTGLMWGLVFVAPAMLPDYPPLALVLGRYIAFGVVAALLALGSLRALAELRHADWLEAARLALVGNLIYYLTLAAGIQRAGVPMASVIIGTLPVVIAVCANWHERSLPWRRLLPPMTLIAAGLALVNRAELAALAAQQLDGSRYAQGIALTLVALVCWTWYPIRNARWLQRHPGLRASSWTTAQGLATGAMALAGWALDTAWQVASAAAPAAGNADGWLRLLGLGPRPWVYLGLMLAMGLLASWLGTLLWSKAAQLLPTSLAGQLIVFETLSALAYGYAWRKQWPGAGAALGIALLVAGVVLGVRAFQQQARRAAQAG